MQPEPTLKQAEMYLEMLTASYGARTLQEGEGLHTDADIAAMLADQRTLVDRLRAEKQNQPRS